MKKVLFVCTGNTCRSPMAEGFFKSALSDDESLSAEYTAASAGIAAYDGDYASEHSIEALRDEWKIDISRHRASTLHAGHIEEAFIILAMTKSHKEYILSIFTAAHQKVFTLKEYVYDKSTNTECEQPEFLDVSDPYGMPLHMYSRCALEIRQAIKKLVEKLKNI